MCNWGNATQVQGVECSNKQNDPETDAQTIPMKRLRDTIINLASSKRGHPVSMEATKRIEALLHQIFPVFKTPDHPPYSEMIYKAIEALDEGEGSSKASISTFIKSNYHDLGRAHESFLTCHLTKLIEKDEIFLAPSSSCNMFRIQKHEEPANQQHEKEGDDGSEILSIKPLTTVMVRLKKCGRPSKPKERKRRGRPPKKEAAMKRGGEESRRGQGVVVVVAPCPPVMPSILA